MKTNWLRRLTALDQNAPIEKISAKSYVPKVGDFVTHSSRLQGTVVAVEQIGGVLCLSVDCVNGRKFRGTSRLEFSLSNGERRFATPANTTTAASSVPLPGLAGEISAESILNELD